MPHSQSNNVAIDEHKRVSFGGEQQLVYDNGLAGDYSMQQQSQHPTKHNTAFTSSDAPPSKVTVKSETSEVPRSISPPAQVLDSSEQQLLSHYLYTPSTVAGGGGGLVVSPPLPSFIKRMEKESIENPFRPDETLYHEVDPIVEAYRRRPFPPSPTGSPIPPTSPSRQMAAATSFQNSPASTANKAPKMNIDLEDGPTMVNEKGKGKKGSKSSINGGQRHRNSSLAEGRTDQQNPLIGEATEALPPPSKAEIVHIDEKKKHCACCSLQ